MNENVKVEKINDNTISFTKPVVFTVTPEELTEQRDRLISMRDTQVKKFNEDIAELETYLAQCVTLNVFAKEKPVQEPNEEPVQP
jgi:hypothetical protein